ncbi:MAG: class D sortase [Bryobacterales bacterium]
MRVSLAKGSLRRILRRTQRALLVAGVLLLGYCAFVLLDSWVFQQQQGRELDRLLDDDSAASVGAPPTDPLTAPEPPLADAPGGLIGRIEIPRLGLSAVVVEGLDRRTLRRAVGHIPGTALPGQSGNAGIAGHRDTFFRPLKDIQVDDIITLTTRGGEYRYRVVSSRVVSPHDVEVLNPTSNEVLTLVTCHPFYFVGPAPNRFIVRAEKVSR